MNKIIFWSSYSDNNLNVFNKSLLNHQKYCNIHKYDLLNFKESYNRYIDVQRILDLFEKYDIVITIGTDIIIKRMQDPIENYIDNSFCITMCREVSKQKVLNGDFIIYIKSDETFKILNNIKANQLKYVDGQSFLNNLVNKNLIKIYNS